VSDRKSCSPRHLTRGPVALLLCGLALLTGACGPTPTPTPIPTPTPASDGEALYVRVCAECHGRDGRSVEGTNSPNLNSQGLLVVADDGYLRETTARGRPGPDGRGAVETEMPPYDVRLGGSLSREEIDLIVGFVRQWQMEPTVALAPFEADGEPSRGRATFEESCAACHGADGWSAIAPNLAGTTFQEVASDAFIRHTVLFGRPGTAMAPFELTDEDLADLIAFIRTLDDG
jgi:cytochrome c oxidase cbb3-type subunit 3